MALLPTRQGSLCGIDLFSPELPNWNALVFGSSGSGKSFALLQFVLMQATSKLESKVVWIDNGASSKRLVELLQGTFLSLNLDSGLVFNPFHLENPKEEPDAAKIKLVLGVLETILTDEGGTRLQKRDRSKLEEIIDLLYREKAPLVPTLSDLRLKISKSSDPQLREFEQILYSWTGSSPFGRLLDGQTNVDLGARLITFETKGLDQYPDLQNVLLLLITDLVRQEAGTSLRVSKILIVDEAWRLFQTPSAIDFVIESYRTFRKFRSSIISISQNYKDFMNNPRIRDSLYPNAATLLVLKQQVDDWDDFASKLGLNDAEIETIRSLEVRKGNLQKPF